MMLRLKFLNLFKIHHLYQLFFLIFVLYNNLNEYKIKVKRNSLILLAKL